MSDDNENKGFDFGLVLQKRLLSMMLRNVEFLIRADKYIEPYFFSGDVLRWLCKEILDYYRKYHVPMGPDIAAEKIKRMPVESQLEYTVIVKEIFRMQVSEDMYLKDALKEFIQRNIFLRGWESIAAAYKTGDAEEAFERFSKTNQSISEIDFSPPDRSYFFQTYRNRKERREARSSGLIMHTFPTCIPELDDLLQGGLKRGEVGMLYADAKIGKSIGLCHMGFASARTRSGRVCHFVLEGGREQAEDRYDARFSEYNYYGLRQALLDPNRDKVLSHEYEQLDDFMVVEGMTDRWDYTVEDLEGKLAELEGEGFVADVLVVDYGDLLMPRKNLQNTYEKQSAAFRDLKTLAQKAYRGQGVAVWTASQIQRPRRHGKVAHPADTDENFVWTKAEIADSYAKIRIVDVAISLNQTVKERDRGEMRLFVSDARDHEARRVIKVKCDFTRMIFNTNKLSFRKQSNQEFWESRRWGE